MKCSITLLALSAVAAQARITSIFNITATPDQVVNASSISTPGQPGARGQFNYALDSDNEIICYDITLTGVTGMYMSPARTATHIHEAARGRNGPPRIALPNPVGDDAIRRSVGCLTGPFTTGLRMADNVTDTGAGFSLKQIEANPAGFFTDSHTALFVPGVVRGQLDQSFRIIAAPFPTGGVPVPMPMPTGTGSPTKPTTTPPQFTGAASTTKVGGLVAVLGLFAALL